MTRIETANTNYAIAFAAYDKARDAFRARSISDADFLIVRAEFEAALAEWESANAEVLARAKVIRIAFDHSQVGTMLQRVESDGSRTDLMLQSYGLFLDTAANERELCARLERAGFLYSVER